MSQRKEHAVGTSSGGWKERGTLADAQREVVDKGPSRVHRSRAAVLQDFGIHEQAVEETIDAAIIHLRLFLRCPTTKLSGPSASRLGVSWHIVNVQFLRSHANIKEKARSAPTALGRMIFVTSALVLESYREYGVTADYALERDIIAVWVSRDLLAERVHHQKIGNLHTATTLA
jgi:hypothetical protein